MARVNVKTVSKTYDTDQIGDWKVNYDYESENGLKPKQINVNGRKDNSAHNFYMTFGDGNNISFSGGANPEVDLIQSIMEEIALINAPFQV